MRAAIIPTHTRPSDFADCVDAIRSQVDVVVAVAHGAEAYGYAIDNPRVDIVVPYNAAVPNISTMWRMGMDAVPLARWVAVLNDDAIVSPIWFDHLQDCAEVMQASGASGWRSPRSPKIAGYAFILDAMSGVRPDERMRWWYSDDAIQRRCEDHSWFTLCPGALVEHRHPDDGIISNPVLRDISNEDRITYEKFYNPTGASK